MHDILQQILYFFGHGFCHQFTERSFEAGGLFFPVCARDTGLYLGFIVTLALLIGAYARTRTKPAAMLPAWALALSVALVLPMAADGLSSYLDLRETNNLLRYLTGYLCGTGVAFIASGGVFSLWPQVSHEVSALNTPGKLGAVLALSCALAAAFYGGYPFLGAFSPFLILVCIWLALTLVVLLILSTTPLWPRGGTGTADATASAVATGSTEVASGATATTIRRRLVLIALAVIAAGVVMTLFSLIASGLGLLLPWYMHP